jgi:hypothetical protein
MTRDDIIRLARESGGADITSHGWTSWVGVHSTEFLERFAALVAAAEREACAKVCHDYATRHGLKGDDNEKAQAWMMLQCAAAIRARGE